MQKKKKKPVELLLPPFIHTVRTRFDPNMKKKKVK